MIGRPVAEENPNPKRPRDAAATRAAILASARKAFARAGYDGAGVREIAGGAGVTAMLVNRYFGSKEQLFAEVLADTMSAPVILSAEVLASENPSERMAAALIALTEAGHPALDGFLIMLHSSSSARAAEIGREQIERHYHQLLTEALDGELAPQRAAIVFALVAGFQVMRQMIGLSALADADPAALMKLLAPLFEQLVEAGGPRPPRARAARAR
jgi:AcrR family transcriptional regulator